MSSMSLSQSYILASKVRVKLTKEASNPRSSLRNLVTQANMLDNIMDHIGDEIEKRKSTKAEGESHVTIQPTSTHVSFSEPNPRRSEATSVTEYEVGSDSDDSDEEIDYDYELESSDESEFSDSEDDYYYSSDEEDVEISPVHEPSFEKLPTMNLSLSKIEEVDEEDEDVKEDAVAGDYSEVPGLCRTLSLTDDEEEIEAHTTTTTVHEGNTANYVHVDHEHEKGNYSDESKVPRSHEAATRSLFEHANNNIDNNHHRTNAIYSMEHIF